MISRRRLIGTGIATVVAGAVSGVIGSQLALSDASIRFIGTRAAILALLDTGRERVLIVLGTPDERLLRNAIGLRTIGNHRLDLIITPYQVLTMPSAREQLGFDTVQTVSVQGHLSLPPVRGEILPVADALEIGLGDTGTLRVLPLGIAADLSTPENPDYLVEIAINGARLRLGSSDAAFRLSTGVSAHLAVVPGSPGPTVLNRVSAPLIVCSSPLEPQPDVMQMPVFPNDPVVVQLKRDGVSINSNQLSS